MFRVLGLGFRTHKLPHVPCYVSCVRKMCSTYKALAGSTRASAMKATAPVKPPEFSASGFDLGLGCTRGAPSVGLGFRV